MKINRHGLKFLFSSILSGFCLISHASLASDPLVLPGRLAASLSNTYESKIVQPTTGEQVYDQTLGVASTAVVIGMMIVNQMSSEQGLLAREECVEINRVCFSLLDDESRQKLKTLDIQDMMLRLQQDKKVSGDQVTMIMLMAPGYLGFVKLTMNADLQQCLWKACDHLGIIDHTMPCPEQIMD